MKYLVFPFLFIAFGWGGCTDGQHSDASNLLSAVDFSKKISETEQALVLDVRTPEEFEKGHLENAVNIDWKGDDFNENISKIDTETPVFVYCLSGGRSKAAAEEMRKLGFEQVAELDGGIMQWRAENLPEIADATVSEGMDLAQYEALLKSDKLVLVDFYADWCEPCKRMEPYLTKIANEMPDEVTLIRIDADANPQLCKDLGVSALPVLKLYQHEKLNWEHEGFIDEKSVRAQL